MSLSCSVFPAFSSLIRILIPGFLTLALSACGGGGSTNGLSAGISVPPPTPGDPVVNAPPRIGNGTGSNFTNGVIAASQATVDAGQRSELTVNVVNGSGQVVDGTVSFASPCATSARATISPVNTVGTGLYRVDYTNINCDGPDVVTATLAASGTNPTATATVTLTTIPPQALTVSFVSTTFDQLSLAGIGGNESAELVFRLTGPNSVPIVGKQVNFSVNSSVGGASILPTRQSGITDQNGNVRTILLSGTAPGTVNVRATHAESGKNGLSGDIIISTGIPVQSRLSLSLSQINPPRAFNTDNIPVTVSVIASDTYGNNPPDGTRIRFVSPESGNIDNSCLLTNGGCSVTWRSSAPRPLDGRLDIIAFTDGAENFSDRNSNGVYDNADLGFFTDLDEPWVDENEDGLYTPGEYFFDTDRDGTRDPGNGLWDGPCLNKVEPTALCSGNSTATIFKTTTIVLSTETAVIASLGTFPAENSTITIIQGETLSFAGLFLSDSRGNSLPVGTTVTFAPDGGGVTLQGVPTSTIQNTTEPTGPYGIAIRATPVQPAADLPTGTRLLLNVQVPGVAMQQFAWPISVIRTPPPQ